MTRSNHPVTLDDLKRGVRGGGDGGREETKKDNGYSVVASKANVPSASSIHTLASTIAQKYAATTNSSSNNNRHPKVCHIPTLPRADEAAVLLQRVVREFLPIIHRRGYNVTSISELCCCNDGLDFEPNSRRKIYKVSNNVWGYNRTHFRYGGKSHTIHLRLRNPQNHHTELHDYEDVAGTLAHELVHCEIGPHNKQFYLLMDDIIDEHASLMASNLTIGGGNNNRQSWPAFGGTGYQLGGAGNITTDNTLSSVRAARCQAVDGQKLGGDTNFVQWMTPREAAVAAAMARQRKAQLRLRGNHCCHPCNVRYVKTPTATACDGGSVADEEEEEEVVEIVETTDPTVVVIQGRTVVDKKDKQKKRNPQQQPEQEGENRKPPPLKMRKQPPVRLQEEKNNDEQQVEIVEIMDESNVIHSSSRDRHCGGKNTPPTSIHPPTMLFLGQQQRQDEEDRKPSPPQRKRHKTPPLNDTSSLSSSSRKEKGTNYSKPKHHAVVVVRSSSSSSTTTLSATAELTTINVIDLTGTVSEEDEEEEGDPPPANGSNSMFWNCSRCTFLNAPLQSVCTMCAAVK